jgi:AcrR family transcriptional regulator
MRQSSTKVAGRPRGPSEQKRRSILTAALEVFAAEGFPRASMEAIAVRARVSNRTIYNHFQNKAELFRIVIEQSATQVADAQTALIDRYFTDLPGNTAELERTLIMFAEHWVRPVPDHADHTLLISRMRAEVGHIPPAAIEGWQQSGPARVRRALAAVFARLVGAELLDIADADLAALHFARLIAPSDPIAMADAVTPEVRREIIEAGVHVFLHGYGRPSALSRISSREPSPPAAPSAVAPRAAPPGSSRVPRPATRASPRAAH